ncbi:hypothetical protein ATANTOWER_024223 [Ataeniobius toweri]|uniref:DBF4-type domain-containing protein n=1 Tax=Ataeniobius toweri TaxID=208326 RepID=A0ABU7BL17_9TELE|nr:hypothetical protein [Ataeniobius toweri]
MQPQQPSNELLGRLCAGDKKLEGKTFYFDNVKKRATTLLLEAISLLGGRVESFLHKDVTFVVTGSQESLKEEKSAVTRGDEKEKNEGGQNLKKLDSGLSKDKRQPVTPRLVACGSRGKALLEKAICKNERQQRSSVLSNAQSWGVKIVFADDVLLYLKYLTRESVSAKHKRPEKSSTKQSLPAVKATALRAPYLKIEDINRKYKPLHMQSVAFPSLYFLGRFSPFESPPPPLFDQHTGQGNDKKREKKVENSFQEKPPTPLSCNPSPWRARKKDTSYCECCHETFTNLEEHLQSDKHRSFVLDPSNYRAVDQLVAEMLPGFDPNPPQQSEESRLAAPLPFGDDCELELCADVEVEKAVQVLEREDSSFSPHIPNPAQSPLSCNLPSPSKDLKFESQNLSFQLTDNQSVHTETHHYTTEVQPQVLSPTMPVLTIEPLNQQLEASCPDAPCLLPDPYFFPPVLSPQAPYSHSIMDPHCPYSDPPILSPQKYNSEETWGARMCETNIEASGSALLLPTLLPVLLARTSLEEERGLNSLCDRSLKCPTRSLSRSNSFPQLSAVAPDPKKRCRSASPEQRSSKRRKTTEEKRGWCEQRLHPSTQQSDNMADVVDCLLLSNASFPVRQPCAQALFAQTCSTFSFSAVQNFTPALFQMDSAAAQPLCFLPSKATELNFSVDNDQTQCAISSRDSQRSHPLSTSVSIEPALIPDLTMRSSGASDSDWDCDLLTRLDPTSAAPLATAYQNHELDQELLHRPCPWMHDSSYESHLHTVLQPSTPASSLCGEDVDSATFSRTVVQIVEVQH